VTEAFCISGCPKIKDLTLVHGKLFRAAFTPPLTPWPPDETIIKGGKCQAAPSDTSPWRSPTGGLLFYDSTFSNLTLQALQHIKIPPPIPDYPLGNNMQAEAVRRV